MINDFQADISIRPRTSKNDTLGLLIPHRPHRLINHVEAVDWSNCPLALRHGITGETKGGPRRRVRQAA
jgi:hypothetical protein